MQFLLSRRALLSELTGWNSGVRLPARANDFSLLDFSQTDSGTQQASYLIPSVKAAMT
jgi:hypothetical protein